jgi:cytochrome c biogenesis protein CcmG/thiol:disulfide interchange protein DsbE
VLLNFWATWCLPCTREIPWFIEFKKTYAAQGLEVVGVSLDEDGWAAVGPYLDERGINYPIVLAVDRLEHQYPDVTALPTTLIVDRAGRVAARHVGLVERSAYEAEIEAALRLR